MVLNNFILDVDGVMTDGKIYYGEGGKLFKVFGPHDSDGLKMLKNHINIQFITADISGFNISSKRIVDHMGFNLTLVPEKNRMEYILGKYNPESTVFMGDGYFDAKIFPYVKLSIAPLSARIEAKQAATYVTPSNASEGAVMDACLYLKEILNVEF